LTSKLAICVILGFTLVANAFSAAQIPAAAKVPVEGSGPATLKGKVLYDGTPPERKSLAEFIGGHMDEKLCLAGDAKDPTWIVDPDKGIANAVVWIKAPPDKYLKVPADKQSRNDNITMDQPQCAFEPHVVAINPSFYDPMTKKQKKTGQVFEILNSAPIHHNTSWRGNPLVNPGANWIIRSRGKTVVNAVPGKADAAGSEDLLSIACDIHKWMTAKVAVFDHPFYAVSNSRGEFEIKDIPAEAELILAVWHESMDAGSLKGAKKFRLKLKPGENVKEISLKDPNIPPLGKGG
jgi:hypothetical protein